MGVLLVWSLIHLFYISLFMENKSVPFLLKYFSFILIRFNAVSCDLNRAKQMSIMKVAPYTPQSNKNPRQRKNQNSIFVLGFVSEQ